MSFLMIIATIVPHLRKLFSPDANISSYRARAWVSTGAKGALHPQNVWTVMSGARWFWQFYYTMLGFTLEFWGFTSDWCSLFQIVNSSPFLFRIFAIKVHIFWEGHKILRNFPLTFDRKGNISQFFVAFSELLLNKLKRTETTFLV